MHKVSILVLDRRLNCSKLAVAVKLVFGMARGLFHFSI